MEELRSQAERMRAWLAPHLNRCRAAWDKKFGPQAERMRAWLAHSPFFRTRRRAVISALVILPVLLCLSYWLLGSIAFAHTATLTDLKGVVQTKREQATAWEPAHKNQVIKNQDRVKTGEMSAATLLFEVNQYLMVIQGAKDL